MEIHVKDTFFNVIPFLCLHRTLRNKFLGNWKTIRQQVGMKFISTLFHLLLNHFIDASWKLITCLTFTLALILR